MCDKEDATRKLLPWHVGFKECSHRTNWTELAKIRTLSSSVNAMWMRLYAHHDVYWAPSVTNKRLSLVDCWKDLATFTVITKYWQQQTDNGHTFTALGYVGCAIVKYFKVESLGKVPKGSTLISEDIHNFSKLQCPKPAGSVKLFWHNISLWYDTLTDTSQLEY